ncbi:unnamed protein product [Rotaria magnacalcarata]|uniref:Uncharacterized protein n=1 Tax=Rotaria magnacalcarata TaxID=392030 RepID=A0A816DUI6_9BILA|nr:unnamed protein product [Rotaria magnacalcarata]CAF1639256.1 unnamed protein product [Rotaria magnacalcarata]CAF2104463.1 unnamed protein product [Rotaria magnacalcarata]CAF2106302.1 unnamed protein product [Rotaria magnacalcarata]CAF2148614.1 unnamed protein product [Rotaria magnacalcarata]
MDANNNMNCCSAYFYTRFTNEDTLIELAMLDESNTEEQDDCILSKDDQSLINGPIKFIKSHSFWFYIFSFIVCIIFAFAITYLYSFLSVPTKRIDSYVEKALHQNEINDKN